MSETVSRYSGPDTSDKRPEESWVAYWDRKRHERHGPDCACLLCGNEELLKTLGKSLLPKDMQGWIED
jgi:hypothetical protein